MQFAKLILFIIFTIFFVGNSAKAEDAFSDPAVEQSENRTWVNRFNPEGRIPEKGFRAFYFNRANPNRIVHRENVKNIAIKYAYSDFHGIPSQNFSAYWVGQLYFEKRTTLQISVSTSWAKARVRINGIVIDDLNQNKNAYTHTFTPGNHIVEVEYINNWHTVEFKVTIEKPVSYLSPTEVTSALKSLGLSDANLAYASVYESKNRDVSLPVVVDEEADYTVLWLESYEAIDWQIEADDEIKAIIVSSYKPGSRVLTNQQTPIILTRTRIKLAGGRGNCHCTAGYFHCESSEGIIMGHERLERITGGKLVSYSKNYSPRFIKFEPYGLEQISEAKLHKQRLAAAKQQCLKHAKPNFDKLFGPKVTDN